MNWKRYLAGVGALFFAWAAAAQTNYTSLFQFAIFYNGLLEFTWCAPLTVNGRTHANGSIYTGSVCQLTFNGLVTTTGTISAPAWDGHPTSDYTASALYNAGYSTNCQALRLSVGTTNLASLLSQSTNSSSLYYNAANLVLLVNNSTVTLTLQTSSADPQPTNITANYYPTNYSATNYVQVATNFPFLTITNSFTDQRERDTVTVTDINMAILDQWLATNQTAIAKFPNSAGVYPLNNAPDVLYVADNRSYTRSQLTAVRLNHGTFIPTNMVNIAGVNQPTGFTVATPNPLYVWGNYNCPNSAYLNTTNTTGVYPASLVSDALTILSPAWVDSQSAIALGGTGKNAATSTTVNAAILTGIVPSTGSGASQYSGGVVNLPRLLENWGNGGSVTLTLNTSLVNLFASTRATNQWQSPGTYYYAPTRQFSFNQNFLNSTQLPPGTPPLGSTSPVITLQPQSQTVFAGQPAVFNVSATGYLPLACQWRFNGTNMPNATNNALFITNASAGNAGSYSVVVTNAFGSQTSSNALLTVNYPPVINAQPVSQAAVPGSGVTFSVSAGGTAPLSYQWTFNGSRIAGGTNSSLTVSGVQPINTGSYYAVVANAAGSVTSSPANLFLANPPDFLWARSAANGAPGAYSAADGVAADVNGNLFVAGRFAITPTLDLGGGVLTNSSWAGSSFANFICEYDRAGNLVWAKPAGTNTAFGWPLRIGTDVSGNAYLAGRFAAIGAFGTNSLISSTPADLFVAKYDPQGQVLWVRQIGAYQTVPSSYYFGFAVDPGGNAFVACRDGGSVNFGAITLTNSAAFLAKYDSAGNLVWAHETLGADAIALGTNGAVCLTGKPGLLAKYDNQGTLIWSNSFPVGQAIVLDAQENIFTTGYGAGTYDGFTLTNSGGSPDCFTAKCDAAGQLQWLRQVGGVQQQHGMAIGLDEYGSVYVTSVSAVALPEPALAFGTTVLTNVFAFVAKYDPAGYPLWARAPAMTNRAAVFALAVRDSADAYMGGYFSGTASIGTLTLSNAYPCSGSSFSDPCSVEMFVAKLDGAEAAGLPMITVGPKDQTVMVGSNATFSVTVPSGIPLSYQWFYDQTNAIAGATGPSLLLSGVQLTNAGSYSVSVSNAYGSVNSGAATLTVLRANPIMTWTNPAPITYGAGLTANQLNAAANVPGSFSYDPTNGTALNVGTNTLSVIFTPTDTVDYNNATGSVNLVVSPAALAVTAANAGRPYGATNPVFSGTITGVQNGDNITATCSSTATINSPVGSYPILPTLVDPSGKLVNYAVTSNNGALTVNPATLTVTASGTLVYGSDPTNAVYTPYYAPLQGTDTVSVIAGSADFSTDATATNYVGTNYSAHVVDLGTLSAANYTFTPGLDGVLSITPASLTVTNLLTDDKTYDGTTNATLDASGAGLDGLVNGDAVTLDSSGATGAFVDKNVGTGKPITVSGLALSGDLGTNYSLVQLSGLTANIWPLCIAVTAATDIKVYDGKPSSVGVPTSSPALAAGDSGSFAQTFDTRNVGTGKTLTPAGVVNDGNGGLNYNVTYAAVGSGEIDALGTTTLLAVDSNPSGLTTNVTFTATVAGVLSAADLPTGDVVFSANGTPFATNGPLVAGVGSSSITASTASLPVGTNALTAQYVGDGNYLGSLSSSLPQVVTNNVICSTVNEISISNNSDGTFTLCLCGTPGAQYYVVSSGNINTSLTNWNGVAGSTNTAPYPNGQWSIVVSNGVLAYYRSVVLNPAPAP